MERLESTVYLGWRRRRSPKPNTSVFLAEVILGQRITCGLISLPPPNAPPSTTWARLNHLNFAVARFRGHRGSGGGLPVAERGVLSSGRRIVLGSLRREDSLEGGQKAARKSRYLPAPPLPHPPSAGGRRGFAAASFSSLVAGIPPSAVHRHQGTKGFSMFLRTGIQRGLPRPDRPRTRRGARGESRPLS